jgi:hypothetical protein
MAGLGRGRERDVMSRTQRGTRGAGGGTDAFGRSPGHLGDVTMSTVTDAPATPDLAFNVRARVG